MQQAIQLEEQKSILPSQLCLRIAVELGSVHIRGCAPEAEGEWEGKQSRLAHT